MTDAAVMLVSGCITEPAVNEVRLALDPLEE